MVRKDEIYDNPFYQEFLIHKNKIKEKYPEELWIVPNSYKKACIFTDEYKQLWKQYLKELGDLMFEPDGLYQKFTWDIMSEVDKNQMEMRSRARNQGNRKTEFNYY